MTVLDYIFLGCTAVGLILGIWKGFLKQVLAIVGVVVVAIGTTYLAPLPEKWLQGVIETDGTRTIVALAATFVVLSIIYAIISRIISKIVNKIPILGWLNRILGAVFSVAVVYMVFSIVVSLILGNTDETFLPKIKELLAEPFKESWIVQNIYGGTEHPEKNFFGNWLMNVLLEKIQSLAGTAA